MTRDRPLILQFAGEAERTAFVRKRVLLRDYTGDKLYLDDDLTPIQVAHRKAYMPMVTAAHKEKKKAVYRDGRVIIDGKVVEELA